MIFVSGIHGVGKTFFCNQVKEQLGINTYSASKLISDRRDKDFSVDKHVSNIDENQLLLLQAIDKLREKGDEFILDGHFCLLDKEGLISRIPMDTYTSLKPDKIILLTEQSSVIVRRRLQRDGILLEESDIDLFQREEMTYAKEVARKLGAQLIISSGELDFENVIKKIREGGR